VESSKSDRAYAVSAPTLFNEAVCECPGYLYRGKCRHRDEVIQQACRWIGMLPEHDKTTICPNCGEPTLEYETRPEYT
jgi:hypothetical protein